MNSRSRAAKKTQDRRYELEEEGEAGPSSWGGVDDGDGLLLETLVPSQDCYPVVVGNIPLYLSRSDDGIPLFIRQFPPEVEELLEGWSDSERSPDFEGFSEASGSSFDGFSEVSSVCSEGSVRSFDRYSNEDAVESGPLEGATTPPSWRDTDEEESECEDSEEFTGSTMGHKGLTMKKSGKARGNEKATPKNLDRPSAQGSKKRKSSIECTPPSKRTKCDGNSENQAQTSDEENSSSFLPCRTRQNVAIESESISDILSGRAVRRRSIETEARQPSKSTPESYENFIGDYCNEVGCTISFLESMKIRRVTVNFGMVYELSEFAKKIFWDKEYIAKWIQRLSGIKSDKADLEDVDKISSILRRRKALTVTLAGQKYGDVKLRNFDTTEYVLPSSIRINSAPPKDDEIRVKNEAETESRQQTGHLELEENESNCKSKGQVQIKRKETMKHLGENKKSDKKSTKKMGPDMQQEVKRISEQVKFEENENLRTNFAEQKMKMSDERRPAATKKVCTQRSLESDEKQFEAAKQKKDNLLESTRQQRKETRKSSKVVEEINDQSGRETKISSKLIEEISDKSGREMKRSSKVVEEINNKRGKETRKRSTVVKEINDESGRETKNSKLVEEINDQSGKETRKRSTVVEEISDQSGRKTGKRSTVVEEISDKRERAKIKSGNNTISIEKVAKDCGTGFSDQANRRPVKHTITIEKVTKAGTGFSDQTKYVKRESKSTNTGSDSNHTSSTVKHEIVRSMNTQQELSTNKVPVLSFNKEKRDIQNYCSQSVSTNKVPVLSFNKEKRDNQNDCSQSGDTIDKKENESKTVADIRNSSTEQQEKEKDIGEESILKSQLLTSPIPQAHSSMLPKAENIVAANVPSDPATKSDQESPKTPSGSLGISKSGRLRKPSAKGIQSIEIKCLFMQNNMPVSAAAKEASGSDKSSKKTDIDDVDKDFIPKTKKQVEKQHKPGPEIRLNSSMLDYSQQAVLVHQMRKNPSKRLETSLVTFAFIDKHLVPNFKELNYNLGQYCTEAGITVEVLNSRCSLNIDLTHGIVKELHNFYLSRGAPKTSLAIRMFKLVGQPIVDYVHLLSTVCRITKAATFQDGDCKLDLPFVMPRRGVMGLSVQTDPAQVADPLNFVPKVTKWSGKKKSDILNPDEDRDWPPAAPGDVKKPRAKRLKKDISYAKLNNQGFDKEDILDGEILETKGKEGCITRGDIYYLYTKWLRNKMAVGGNVFVTDLLRDVEQLMKERNVATIRIPAGTLMSSSVKLLDEYKEMLVCSKEDALMYLEEDWLEDIQYLLSKQKVRRVTLDEDSTGRAGSRSDSEVGENIHNIRDTRDFAEPMSRDPDWSDDTDNSHAKKACKRVGAYDRESSKYMNSIGKRMKHKRISDSLEEYEENIRTGIDQWEDRDPINKEVMSRKVMNTSNFSSPAVDYEVEKILNYKEVHYKDKTKRLCYLVRWLRFGPDEDSWVNEEDLQCEELLKEYWSTRKKPRGKFRKAPASTSGPMESFKQGKSRSNKPLESPDKLSSKKSVLESPESAQSHNTLQVPKTARKESPSPVKQELDKENVDNIIHAMLQFSTHEKETEVNGVLCKPVTRRELLEVYDNWREENQSELIAGGSHSINLELLVERVRVLMESRGVTTFHPVSLLNACFMMTLMRTRLKSKKAQDMFLDGSCCEVLRASHMQHVKRQYCNIDKTADMKYLRQKDSSIYKLQSDFQSLRQDFATIKVHREIDQYKLGALEEELECLQNAFAMSQDQITTKTLILNNELEQLKIDLETLNNGVDETANLDQEDEGQEGEESNIIEALANLGVVTENVESIQQVVARRLRERNS